MISQEELEELILEAFDEESDVEVEPAQARKNQAKKISQAIAMFVIGRQVIVTGVTPGSGTTTGTVQ